MMKKNLLILFFCVFVYEPIIGKTYFVAINGNNSNNGLSKDNPWKTLTYAAGNSSPVTAGDTVFIKAGNYGAEFVVFSKNGTALDPIVYQGYQAIPKDMPLLNYTIGSLLNASIMPLFDGANRANNIGFNLIDKSYIVLNNFQITNYKSGLITGKGHHLTINNINTMFTGDSLASYSGFGIQLGASGTASSDNNLISNCLVVNSSAEGISVFGNNNTVINSKVYCNEGKMGCGNHGATDYYMPINGNDNTIENCYVERVGNLEHYGHGIGFKYNCLNNIVTKCKSVNMSECFYVRHRNVKYNTFFKCIGIRGNSITVRDGASNNVYLNCISDSSYAGIDLYDTSEDGGAQYAGRNNEFKNCIIKNASHGIHFNNYDQISPVDSNLILNCTFYNIGNLIRSNRLNYENKMINCIVSNVKTLSAGTYSVSVNFQNSNFFGNGFATPMGSNNISLNPMYVNAAKGDFRLQKNSPCINTGTNLTTVLADADEIKRPQQAIYDMGAYEFSPQISTSNEDPDDFNIDIKQKIDFLVYPNPVIKVVTVETPDDKGIIAIYDLSGKEVYSNYPTSMSTKIDMSDFENGIYFIRQGDNFSFKINKISTK